MKWLVTVMIALFVFACGGGSRGTGDLTIDGSVKLANGSAVVGVSVTVLRTGDSAVTGTNGDFQITTEPFSGEPQLLVETGTQSVTSQGGAVALEDERVQIDVVLEAERATQTVTPIKKRDPVVRPTPTPVSTPSGSGGSGSGGGGSGGDGDDREDDRDDEPGASPSPAPDDEDSDDSDNRFELLGTITSLTADSLVIDGTVVVVNVRTDFGDRESLLDFSVGEVVEVRGTTVNDQLIADRVRLKQ